MEIERSLHLRLSCSYESNAFSIGVLASAVAAPTPWNGQERAREDTRSTFSTAAIRATR